MKLRNHKNASRDHQISRNFPHNQIANNLYNSKVLKDRARLESMAERLIQSKILISSCKGIDIKFNISGKYLKTEYELENGGSAIDTYKFKSIFANNDPQNELILALARAECNAELAKSPGRITLFSYPAIGFLITQNEANKFRNQFRRFAKTYLLRFK